MDKQPEGVTRGQPLVALATVVLFWIALRIATFDAGPGTHQAGDGFKGEINRRSYGASVAKIASSAEAEPTFSASASPGENSPLPPGFSVKRWPHPSSPRFSQGDAETDQAGETSWNLMPERPIYTPASGPVPFELRITDTLAVPAARKPRVWFAEAWIFLRSSGREPGATALLTPTLGGSQAGAIVRYSIDPHSGHRPTMYSRAVKALSDGGEGHLAVGFSARPIPAVPLDIHIEGRANFDSADSGISPAAFVTGGVDDLDLPLGLSGSGYGQAGYVGGRTSSPFADGSVLVEKRVLDRSREVIFAGAGIWAGAQKNATRLDLGPNVTVLFPLGSGLGRLSTSYRWRIGGDAAPEAGAAVVSLSAGY